LGRPTTRRAGERRRASCVGLLGPRRSWANGFSRAGRDRRDGSRGLRLAARRGLGRKAESQRGERKEIFYFCFSFSNISNAFSNSFCNPFHLEVKTNQSQNKNMHHVCTSMYLTLLLILFIKNYFSRLKCSRNCGNKSNSPIFKMMQVLGCYSDRKSWVSVVRIRDLCTSLLDG
jgi:hypothetical protein